MLLKMNDPFRIDALQGVQPEDSARLRELLVRGAIASADPNRKEFYDVEDGFRVFYIHVCPAGNVLFLAAWPKGIAQFCPPTELRLGRTSAA